MTNFATLVNGNVIDAGPLNLNFSFLNAKTYFDNTRFWSTTFQKTATNLTNQTYGTYTFMKAFGDVTLQTYNINYNDIVTNAIIDDGMEVLTVYDECNNSSIDTTKWTTAAAGGASATEDATGILVYGTDSGGGSGTINITGSISSKGSGNLDLQTYNKIVIGVNSSSYSFQNGGPGNATLLFRLTDGSNYVTLDTAVSADSGDVRSRSVSGLYELYNDIPNKIMVVFKNGVFVGNVDYTSLSAGGVYIHIYAQATSGTGTAHANTVGLRFNWMGYNPKTASSTITKTASANGTNWISLPADGYITFSNTGKYIAYKNVITKHATDLILFKNYFIQRVN